jgi:type I restriction enzyme M protein
VNIEGDAYGLYLRVLHGEMFRSVPATPCRKGESIITPASIVKAHRLRSSSRSRMAAILDPACGSGGMFVHFGRVRPTVIRKRQSGRSSI